MMYEAGVYMDPITEDFHIEWLVDREGIIVLSAQSDESIVPTWKLTIEIQDDEALRRFLAQANRVGRELATYLHGNRHGPTPETQRHWDEKHPST